MLRVQGLTLSLRRDGRELARDLTFTLNPGDKMAVIGEEGDGKSTLLKLLYDEALAAGYAQWSGTIRRGGGPLGYLAQEVAEADKARSVYDFCRRTPAFLESSPRDLAQAAGGLGLAPALFYDPRPLGTLSGGEKVKLRLALLALARPDAYLLDEPSNDLDIPALEGLERFILGCPQPVLFVSHDETLLERAANAVLHLEQLRRKTLPRWTLARVGYREYADARLRAFAHQERVARKEREEDEKRQEKLRRIAQKVERQQNAISPRDPHGGRLLKKKMKSVKSMERRFDRERAAGTELPDAEDAILARFAETPPLPAGKTVLDLSLPQLSAGEGGPTLARGIRLFVRGPEHVGIVGRNGAGKTTLLRRVAGELLARRDLRAAYMPQDYAEGADLSLTPAAFLARTGEKAERAKILTALGGMKFTAEETGRPLAELSGGQRAKAFLLKMALEGGNVLILDEPTRNLSPLSGPVIRQALRDFPGCILSVSHDRKYLEEVCDVVYELREDGLARLR